MTTYAARCQIESATCHKYFVTGNHKPLSFGTTLELWQSQPLFRSFFISLLSESTFSAYRWETPPLNRAMLQRNFEFVLLDSPDLVRAPDRFPFSAYFVGDLDEEGIVAFKNLGRDATLVVPSPRGPDAVYSHLAAFVRGAPESQQHALWRVVGQSAGLHLTERPLWISTAGGGVAWLHVRLDRRPKYYGYTSYRSFPALSEGSA